jgi:DNA primase
MRFPSSFLERLRSQLTVSEVIGRRITIKKHGREFQALCPFHNEKTPSFTINDDKNFFHCFGCGAHGDAIGFVMSYERLPYPEAVERLAREAGVPMPEFTPEESRRAEKEKEQLGVLEAACRWFEEQLSRSAHAKQYIEKRGLVADTIKKFRIGYAPDERDSLYHYLLKQSYSVTQQLEAGLIGRSEDGSTYDRFRGRIMFPIRTPRGDVIAFGGRLIVDAGNKSLPKYLNSPETPLFKKGEMLYNLDLAKRAVREQERAVILEGYMDVVSVAQSGVEYAVATLGTAVTTEHLKLLWKICKEPVLCLDGDAAGKRAMSRAAEVALPLLQPGYSLRFAVLPMGEDPDSYVQKFGAHSFEEILKNARPLYQQMWNSLLADYAPRISLPEGRAALEAACKQATGKIQEPSVAKHYADFFKSQLWEKVRARPSKPTERAPAVTQLAALENPHAAKLDALVASMLRLLIDFPPLLHKSSVEETLSSLNTKDNKMLALRDALLAAVGETGLDDKTALITYLETRFPSLDLKRFYEIKPSSLAPTLDAAWRMWNEAVASHHIKQLESELVALETMELSEATHARMLELQATIKATRSARNFAPISTDAA